MDYINADNVRKQAYDKEVIMHQSIQKWIYFIESNPAFEFWLLLHLSLPTGSFATVTKAIKDLKKSSFGFKSNKNF